MVEITLHLEIDRKPHNHLKQLPNKIMMIRCWFSRNDKIYPFNFLGHSPKNVAESLGISPLDGAKLIVAKINQYIKTCEDAEIVRRLKVKRNGIKGRFGLNNLQMRCCVMCGVEFKPRNYRHTLCKICAETRSIKFLENRSFKKERRSVR